MCARLALMSSFVVAVTAIDCSGQTTWPALYRNYTGAFLDTQIRVIDRDAGDRTTSEGQAYAMFFALVANDRPRFDGLLRWAEQNLAAGDLTAQLPRAGYGAATRTTDGESSTPTPRPMPTYGWHMRS